ncbi:hypothetical protein ACFU5P_00735 [Streptomyces sp. NPDC057433]|uniref:hypothetical protein n=1 Tax=Streptomyces sp. NPDC057433 TaxID=3346132 RepID=UPI00367EA6E9
MSGKPTVRVQVNRVPGKPVRRQDDGTLAIDLWLCRDGVFDSDAALRLTPAEAEVLHAQLCYALDDDTAALIVPESKRPDCRKGVATGRGRR